MMKNQSEQPTMGQRWRRRVGPFSQDSQSWCWRKRWVSEDETLPKWWWWFSCYVVSASCGCMDCSLPGSCVHGDSPDKNTGMGSHCLWEPLVTLQISVSHTQNDGTGFYSLWVLFHCRFYRSQFSAVQSLSCVWLFATPWTAACQASRSITNSQSPPKPMSIELVTPSSHLILCRPLLLPLSISPSIRVFSNESIHWQ